MFPLINIELENGQTGGTNQTDDGVMGLIVVEPATADMALGVAKVIFSLTDAEDLGIVSGGNPRMHAEIKSFYSEAGDGSELWIMLSDETVSKLVDFAEPNAAKFLTDAGGRINVLGISGALDDAEEPELVNGIPKDINDAIPKAQLLAEISANKFNPIRIILAGHQWNGEVGDLADHSESVYNRVAMCISGDDVKSYADIGAILGRLAVEPVQRRLSRVASGSILGVVNASFSDKTTVESKMLEWKTISDKGYIFYRTLPRKAGIYFNYDPTLTSGADDYFTLARGRVIDKAYLLTYDVLINKVSDDFNVDENGFINPGVIKNWELDIENSLNQNMVEEGNASSVSATIDPKQNIISDSQIVVSVKIQPRGYSDIIEVSLGYSITQS